MKKNSLVGKVFITNSFEETQKIGRDFAKVLENGDVIYLYGDLGSGKTTFVQGVARGLGMKKKIISPTFIIVRCYKLKAQKSKRKTAVQNLKFFYHIDLYRIESKENIEGLGLEEIVNNKNNIVAIEWAEKLGNLLSEKKAVVEFKHVAEDKRQIMIKKI